MRRHSSLLVSLALVGALAGCGSSSKAPAKAAASPRATAAPTAQPDVDVALTADDAPQNPFLAFGSVWVAAHHAKSVVRLDPATGATIARITTGGDQPGAMAAGAGLLWVTHYGATRLLVGIDPKSNAVVHSYRLPGESCCEVAVTGRTVWVTAAEGDKPTVVGVDAVNGRVGKRFAGADGPLVVGAQLWVTHDGKRAVADPASGTITPTAIPAGVALLSGVAADGLIWGTSGGGAALGLSPDGVVRRTVLGPGGKRLFYGDGGSATPSGKTAWITDGSTKLWRIRSASAPLELVAILPADRAVSMTGDGTGGVWVALFSGGRLLHYAS